MNEPSFISSLQNPLVKEIVDLSTKSRKREEQQKFVVEGLNELRLCIAAGYQLEHILFDEAQISAGDLMQRIGGEKWLPKCIRVSSKVFEKIAYRKDVRNAIAVVQARETSFGDIVVKKDSIFLIAEGIEKPGNLGAILRSADALNIAGVILANSRCDLYNPNVIRGSVGCAFTVPVVSATNEEVMQFIDSNNLAMYTTFMENASLTWDTDFLLPAAIAVGTESTGLTDFWRRKESKNINVPMAGKVDSLNVSVAVSLLLYEAKRQINKAPNSK